MEFDEAIKFILKEEGGYVNDPKDSGGETNYGISKRAFPNEDIKGLTIDRAKWLYFEHYWKKGCCDKMPDNIQLMHLDACVNMGIGAASKILQKTIGVEEDGVIGAKTMERVNRGVNLYWYAMNRMNAYMTIITANPKNAKFAKGWSGRVLRVMNYKKE